MSISATHTAAQPAPLGAHRSASHQLAGPEVCGANTAVAGAFSLPAAVKLIEMAMLVGEVIGWFHFSALDAARDRSRASELAAISSRARATTQVSPEELQKAPKGIY